MLLRQGIARHHRARERVTQSRVGDRAAPVGGLAASCNCSLHSDKTLCDTKGL
jgi:hypothetical protein